MEAKPKTLYLFCRLRGVFAAGLIAFLTSGCAELIRVAEVKSLNKAYASGKVSDAEYRAKLSDIDGRYIAFKEEAARNGAIGAGTYNGPQYINSGASWQPRDAKFQQDSGQRYSQTSWTPMEPRYERDSGQAYRQTSWRPRDPQYERDSGHRYTQTGQPPQNARYEGDTGQRYTQIRNEPSTSPQHRDPEQRYVSGARESDQTISARSKEEERQRYNQLPVYSLDGRVITPETIAKIPEDRAKANKAAAKVAYHTANAASKATVTKPGLFSIFTKSKKAKNAAGEVIEAVKSVPDAAPLVTRPELGGPQGGPPIYAPRPVQPSQ